MKKNIGYLLMLVLVCLCCTACNNADIPVSDVVTDPETGEVINTATEYVTNNNGYIVQPSNALQEPISGMLMCYLDYIVEDVAYLEHVSVAVTPEIIQTPAQFEEFFATPEQPDSIAKANALYSEMTATPEGAAIYRNSDFYDSWNLIVLSVREANAETKHTIDSVSYNVDSCIFYVNGTRDVADAEGEAVVRHYVFRVPKNVYNGVSHSFTKVE
ncbi:MAG: hypothetical protein E7523_03320 [Ruminococcaceae bacterium]|nr:hypothetical protein [Oscillospiraceae bacterium]